MPNVAILGISGSGKSTLAGRLCAVHGLTHVDLDGLHHLAHWTPNPRFVEDVTAALDAAPGGWVVDGNYLTKLGDSVLGRADVVLWLDLPRWLPTWRATRRTAWRFATRQVLWNGNRETWRDIFAGYAPIRWSWSQSGRIREQIGAALEAYPDLDVHRIYNSSDVNRLFTGTRWPERFDLPLE